MQHVEGSDNQAAVAVSLLSGLTTLVFEGLSIEKVVAAFGIAIATGAGYKLGSICVVKLIQKFNEAKKKDEK